MSSIFSELVAEILFKRAESVTDSEKLLIGSVLGVSGAEIYAAVISHASESCVVHTGHGEDDQLEMRCIALDNNVIVIPYLVLQGKDAAVTGNANRGNRFFNGKLRDWFDRNVDDGAIRVLVTFDESPIETEKSAMDGGLQASLSAKAMLEFAGTRIQELSDRAVAPLVTQVLSFVRGRANLGARDVAHTVHALREIAVSPNVKEAGNALVKLPWLLRDPAIEASTAYDRLGRAKSHRERLDGYVASATEDFEQNVRTLFNEEIAERLITSRSLDGVDWEQFTLDQLERGLRIPDGPSRPSTPNGLDPSKPATVDTSGAQVFKLVEEGEKGRRRYGFLSLASPGKIVLDVSLIRELGGRETLHLFVYQSKGKGFVRTRADYRDADSAGGLTQIRFELDAVPLNENWCFFEVVLTEGVNYVKNFTGRIDFGILISSDLSALPYESRCLIDASSQCFVADDQADLELIESDGTVRAIAAEDVRSEGVSGSDMGLVTVSVGGQDVALPMRYEVAEEREPTTEGEHSIEHALLRFAALERVPIENIERSNLVFGRGGMKVKVGGVESTLKGIPLLKASRWTVESAILKDPTSTAYSISADGEISVYGRLNSLAMNPFQDPAFERFLAARRVFFETVRQRQEGDSAVPTILGCRLDRLPEAQEYIEAYFEVLASIVDGTKWKSEFERILLVDSVVVDGTDAVFIAPTHPLSVALHRDLQEKVNSWASALPTSLRKADPDALLPTHLLPIVKIGDHWYESEITAYPWRMYRRREDAPRSFDEPFLPGFIARRIMEFLEVHPIYRDQRRILTLAFVNPGDAGHVLAALQRTVDEAAKQRGGESSLDELPRFENALDELPMFEVKLYGTAAVDSSGGAVLGSALDAFMSNMQESPPTWKELELMRRLTYTKGPIENFVDNTSSSGDASAFAHIAFIQDYFRPGERESYNVTERTSTAYVSGMAVDLERSAEVNANDITFSSGVWLGTQNPAGLLSKSVLRSLAVAAAAGGNPVSEGQALGIVTRAKRELIPAIYQRAVWVVHLDRHIGLELFAPQETDGGVTPYILDHTDQENLQASGFDAITATAMVGPYLKRIGAIFGRHVDGVDDIQATRLLRWLNLLSGRWALRLLKEPDANVKERLGAVVAYRLLVVREGIYSDTSDFVSVVISLDEILRVTGKEGLKTTQGLAKEFGLTGGASDDLLLLRVGLRWDAQPTLNARVIEVKYSEGAPPVGDAWKQVSATQEFLQQLFGAEGPGRPFRGRMLSKLIRSYVSRLQAFGLLDPQLDQASNFVRTMDSIGAGDYDFVSEFKRSGKQVTGDFVSVEPNYEVPVYQGDPYNPTDKPGRAMGRIRVGGAMIEALVSDSSDARTLGEYVLPHYGMESKPVVNERQSGPNQGPQRQPDRSESAHVPEGSHKTNGGSSIEPTGTEEGSGTEVPEAGNGASALRLAERFALPQEEVCRLADQLDQTFARYQLPVQPFQPSSAQAGPNVVRFRTRMLDSGTIGKIEARTRDIQRELGIEDPVYVGQEPPFIVVDIPRLDRKVITFGDVLPVLAEVSARAQPGVLPVVMGVDAAGKIQTSDLAALPHLMVAGTTGSGKSVFLLTLGACLGLLPPSRLELVVIDIKGIDLNAYAQLPQTYGAATIDDPAIATALLEELMSEEVAKRKAIFRRSGSRHIAEHYARTPESEWPKQIVVVIDEYAQLVSASGQQRSALEGLVQQFAQFARAFGIYLVLATQRPSVDVITGRIKANLPARCVFKLPSFSDSRTVIDSGGAEKLLGSGDMLFYRDGVIQRLQAVYTGFEDFGIVASRNP
jgi:hypothetical protein